ncbi:hypothetical protein CDL15_Pgr009279 [Punica granatum]|uniref:Cyclin-like domain-containing protein n=1 Tax=Punica granatum TaxID=22663 RepID=A0A218WRY2_PUNGR|nr:hypothetical protein CDL15_Pgr009279 [Punica granatum]
MDAIHNLVYVRKVMQALEIKTIATVCMFLAGKVEETPRPLKDVILVSYEIIHKKDQTAAQRIKQKEVYEQQKELILLGERVVLATLGFDLNVHHPYKPLVEAIKKFKVAQNALAQVAWNFVNDGLRTSLCLQFKPHHIAAGAIFLAAKFLKVKLPSDGEKVWWQEFDVTPRQLEEVSNQMLELYEQNRVPPSQGSEVEGSTADGGGGGSVHRASSKVSSSHEEHASKQVSSRAPPDHFVAESHGAPAKATQNQNNGHGSVRSDITDHKVDAEPKDDGLHHHHYHPEHLSIKEDTSEVINRSKERIEGEDHHERNGRRNEPVEAGEWVEDATSRKPCSVVGRHLELREGSVGQSPKEPIKIDKDKVKAALEKRRKVRAEMTKKKDVMDEDDLIERELEDGIELAPEDEKRRERRLSLPKTERSSDHGREHDEIGGDRKAVKGQLPRRAEVDNPEEGEMFEDTSPMPNSRKRKGSPSERQMEGKKRHDYSSSHNGEDGHRAGRFGYADKEHRRHEHE